MKQLEPFIWPYLEKVREKEREREREREREKKRKKKEIYIYIYIQRRYKEPRWVEKQKVIHAKVRGIPLSWGPRQKLGIEREVHPLLLNGMGKIQEKPKWGRASLKLWPSSLIHTETFKREKLYHGKLGEMFLEFRMCLVKAWWPQRLFLT